MDHRWARAQVLQKDPHLREQVERQMPAYRLLVGDNAASDVDSIIEDVALAIAILEAMPQEERTTGRTVDGGALVVQWNPASGYNLLLRGPIVYLMRLEHFGRPDTEEQQA